MKVRSNHQVRRTGANMVRRIEGTFEIVGASLVGEIAVLHPGIRRRRLTSFTCAYPSGVDRRLGGLDTSLPGNTFCEVGGGTRERMARPRDGPPPKGRATISAALLLTEDALEACIQIGGPGWSHRARTNSPSPLRTFVTYTPDAPHGMSSSIQCCQLSIIASPKACSAERVVYTPMLQNHNTYGLSISIFTNRFYGCGGLKRG